MGIETPPLKVVGVTGYINTPDGPRSIKTVWAARLSDEVRRRFYRNWFSSKKKAFTKSSKKYESEDGKKSIDRDLALLKKYAVSIRAICHTQMKGLSLRQKEAHLIEIQVNGGSIAEKVDWCYENFEKEVAVTTASPRVGTRRSCRARLTRVSARSPVLVHGIRPVSPSQLPVPVRRVTITVPRSTRRSTALAPVTTPSMASSSRTTPPPRSTSLTRASTLLVASSTTVWLRTTLFLSRVASLAPRSVP